MSHIILKFVILHIEYLYTFCTSKYVFKTQVLYFA